ncbi:MAG: pyridoxal-phosphate dependent enzyme [Planctomycetes bacterium]|nr:pyridoxal-phosphate dependent enzyme [Planctomycetota bacterium]
MKLIDEARAFLAGRIRRTPLEESPALSRRLGGPAWLKLEFLQITGSFKARGALFRSSRLEAEERRRGVATCSAGNHGLGMAHAARELGLEATVYVPSRIDESKLEGIRALGVKVIRSPFPGFDDAEAWAKEEARRAGRSWISAFDDPAIMAANGGTIAAEIIEDLPEAKSCLFPVGGGGLGAGLAFYLKQRAPALRLIACQHERSPALKLSLDRGEAITRLPAAETLAGGLEGGIGAGPFAVLKDRLSEVALVSEEEIFEAVRWLLAEHRYLIEPSAAASLAACLAGKVPAPPLPAVIILTGRNVSLSSLERILGR